LADPLREAERALQTAGPSSLLGVFLSPLLNSLIFVSFFNSAAFWGPFSGIVAKTQIRLKKPLDARWAHNNSQYEKGKRFLFFQYGCGFERCRL
jgi:hypothetical protein